MSRISDRKFASRFLSLPRAFDKAGLAWASFLCFLVGAASFASSTWVVHSMSNTEALLRLLRPDQEVIGFLLCMHAISSADALPKCFNFLVNLSSLLPQTMLS